MNEKEICFIICVNSKLYMEECIYYISHLAVPDGYQINVLTIEDAKSMTAGYNEAMQCSKAKYKVYLHQDTFIVNPDFIQDFLNVFQTDDQIGMIGMVGAPRLPESGVMWEAERCGAVYNSDIIRTDEGCGNCHELTEVEVIDGLLMITQYDIPWREDLFDKWDFYDCSQSKEFARRGYKVVVPPMQNPWCLHDSGMIKFGNYESERLKFLKEYCIEEGDSDSSDMELSGEESRYKATVILTTYNQKKALMDTLTGLEGVDGISDIIIVDNGSTDGTAEWLSTQSYEYIWFDEGIQGYGKLWNTVLENFGTEDYIVFMETGVYPDRQCIPRLAEALQSESVGIASPVSTNFLGYQKTDEKQNHKILFANWEMWMIKRTVFQKNGRFQEKLKKSFNVLTDYELRLIKNGFHQMACPMAGAHANNRTFYDIYPDCREWENEDGHTLRTMWKMNYFKLTPNYDLVEKIREDTQKKFKALEIGCDMAATLFAIRDRYPNCRIYGLDINEAAVDVAKHIADVKYGNIDELRIPFSGRFDYIIFGDVLEHLRRPEEVVKMCRDVLNDNGCILASIPNVMNMSVIEGLIDGKFSYQDAGLLDRTHIHLFTYFEILKLFQEAGYRIEGIEGVRSEISARQKQIQNVLSQLSSVTEPWMYEVFQYFVKARKI